jgi:hypothetical protein
MKTYIWAHDAGHEWLAVKINELVELGIADKITDFSYVKGSTAYLEGDCDAATFINAYTKKHGVAPKTKQGKYWDRQPCRSFARYTAPTGVKPISHIPRGRHLNDYVEQRNSWMAIFDKESINFPLTQQGVDAIIDRLDGDLSPENLHCDGEISPAQAQAKYNFYSLVARELEDYCSANGLHYKEPMEL